MPELGSAWVSEGEASANYKLLIVWGKVVWISQRWQSHSYAHTHKNSEETYCKK